MGGINSLSGLNNVSVDFRPEIGPNVQDSGNANEPKPGADAVPENVPQAKAEVKSVVQKLDVLLLGAAGKSVSADAAANIKAAGKTLVDLNVLSQEEVSKLESLAKSATAKLKALDKFTGRELAKALMKDKTGDIVWNKGFWSMNSTAKAVKAAIEAQQALSEAVEMLVQRLAANDNVTAELQNSFTEVKFQCDRRVSEIDAIVYRMCQHVQQDIVDRVENDPQVTALLNATFKELVPREAIMSHGTAEALDKVNAAFAAKMRPLVEKLDAFKADGAKVLSPADILALQCDMADMKSALMDVRRNGIDEVAMTSKDGTVIVDNNGNAIKKTTVVDATLLDEMEKLLAEVSSQIADAKQTSVKRSRQAFLEEVKTSLMPERAPGGDKVMLSGPALGNNVLSAFKVLRLEFVELIRDFAIGTLPMDQFDAKFDECIAKFNDGRFDNFEAIMLSVGFDTATSKSVAKTVDGLHLVKAQFKDLMVSSAKLENDGADAGLAQSDVRRIMLGEVGLSNVIEARARGFKAEDVDPAAEESNIVSSKTLGAGAAGKTYVLTTKSGKELVFKPELESRIGLSNLALGAGSAYADKQNTANLNLATQDTAKVFGCEDLVVKYSVGSHDGQFGVFMEKAKGYTGNGFAEKSNGSADNGIAPADMHKSVMPGQDQVDVQGVVAQKLSKLRWLDLITGQGDRHWNNYFVKVEKSAKKNAEGNDEKDAFEVTVKAIDNDASFSARQIGLQKYFLDKDMADLFDAHLKKMCEDIHGKGWEAEYSKRVSKDPGIAKGGNGSKTVDLGKVESPEVKMAIVKVLGLQLAALPEEIDRDFYDTLMAMDGDPSKKQAYLDSIKPRISKEALQAAEARLNEAIEYAKELGRNDKVYSDGDWKQYGNLRRMSGLESKVTIAKSDGKEVEVDWSIECVNDFLVRNCPSLYKRDYFHKMFKRPSRK